MTAQKIPHYNSKCSRKRKWGGGAEMWEEVAEISKGISKENFSELRDV